MPQTKEQRAALLAQLLADRFARHADAYHSADYFEDRAATTPAGDSKA